MSNAWATYPKDGDNRGKLLLIPDTPEAPHGATGKGLTYVSPPYEGPASD